MSRRVGVYGGTFDPIHLAHLVLADRAREHFKLDQVLFIPASSPPHKLGRQLTPGKQRLEMIELALAGNDDFAVSDIELRREGVSYTVLTLRDLHARHPDTDWSLLVGSDNLVDLGSWYEPAEIVRLAKVSVAARQGQESIDPEQLGADIPRDEAQRIVERVVPLPRLDISSTEIRARVSAGLSIRYLVPSAVEIYIREHALYSAVE